jgi:tetratricopeptide (TPR) repeat protein
MKQGRYSEAEPLYRRALAIREEQLGATHPSTATCLNNLATLSMKQGRYSEAEPLYRRALAIREEQLGATHPNTAQSLNNLAMLSMEQGHFQEAAPLMRRAATICLGSSLGVEHPLTQQILKNYKTLLVYLYPNGDVEALLHLLAQPEQDDLQEEEPSS